MVILFAGAIICLILGAALVFNKDAVNKAEKALNRVVFNTSDMNKHSLAIGVFLMVFSLALLCVAFLIKR